MKTLIKVKEDTDFVWVKSRENGATTFDQVPFNNYIYVSDCTLEQIQNHNKFLDDIVPMQDANGKTFYKLVLKDNTQRNFLKYNLDKTAIHHYEADIMAHKRYLIDNPNLQLNSEGLTWVMYDIETKDDGLFEKDMNGTVIAREPILSIAYKDNTGRQHFVKNMNKEDPITGEYELLKQHNLIAQEYDCILGWNSYRFDDSYVKQRNQFHGHSNLYWDFINQLDYMEMVKKNLGGLSSYSLNGASRHVLNDTKIDMQGSVGNGGIYRSWLASFDGDTILEEYNMQDVDLMYKMEEKLNFIKLHMVESKLAHCTIQETMHNSDICDYMILNEFKKRNLVSPSKPNPKEVESRKENSILGAYTFCYEPGVHEDVDVFDFKSFYPTSMAACNICLTTILYHDELTTKTNYVTIPENELMRGKVMVKADTKYFDNKKNGIISHVAKWLIDERDKVKYAKFEFDQDSDKFKEMKLYENAIKTVANSIYGALSFVYFRYYNFDVASSVTQFCRGVIMKSIAHAQSLGFIVVQGDTDSIMFKKGPDCKYDTKDLEASFYTMFDEVAEEYNINHTTFSLKNPATGENELKPHFIVFEHEKTFHKMISIKKKNYADLCELMDGDGNPTGQFKISITGLECKKKDTNPLAKKIQYNLVEAILRDTFEESQFMDYMNTLYDDLVANKFDPKNLIMRKSLNKNPEDYGKVMIDGETGEPKKSKDGTLRYSPVPAHVKLAKQLIAKGQDIYVGDAIQYIVKSTGPIEPISVDDYISGEEFDREYYWERIVKPVLKVLFVANPELVVKNPNLWSMKEMNEKQMERFVKKLHKEAFKDDE